MESGIHQNVVGPQVVTQSMPFGSYGLRHKFTLFKLGNAEIVLGSILLIISLLPVIMGIGHPTFSIAIDILLIVSGILGVSAKSNPSLAMYNANIVLSILAAIALGVITGLHFYAVAALIAVSNNYPGYTANVVTILVYCSTALCLVSTIVCIVHFSYGCAGVCCRQKPGRNGTVFSRRVNNQLYMNGPNVLQLHQMPTSHMNPVYPTMPGHMEDTSLSMHGNPNRHAMPLP